MAEFAIALRKYNEYLSHVPLVFSPWKLSLQTANQFNEGEFIRQEGHDPQFSHNSCSYRVKTIPPYDRYPIYDIFVKQTPYAQDEAEGAKLASQYFWRVLAPHVASSGELLYPFFQGRTASEVRLSYILGGRKNRILLARLLEVELAKAGDTLQAYQRTLYNRRLPLNNRPNIQRFYHDRLHNDTRIRAHYGKGIVLGGQTIPLDTLLSLRWIINGKTYPSLRQAYDESMNIIRPGSTNMTSCPKVFGLGDAHGGNVMVKKHTAKGPSDILYIDYEVAGYHPVMLDLAKPLYNDLAYEILYRKLIPNGIDLRLKYKVDLENNTIVLDYKPRIDDLTQALFNIKLRYLLEPLCDRFRAEERDADRHVPLLSTALFLCATLGVSLAGNEEAFLANFATGHILRRAQTWGELLSGLDELGIKH